MGSKIKTTPNGNDEQHWSNLMVQSQRGDAKAYNQLLAELSVVTEKYLRAHFGDLYNLEDCIQEGLLAIHRARHTYDAKRLFRPWFFTIIHHKTIDILRRNEPHKKAVEIERELDKSEISHVDLDRMIDGERLMFELSHEQREAITLTKFIGMTAHEASVEVGVTESTLKARLRRGLDKIKTQWQVE